MTNASRFLFALLVLAPCAPAAWADDPIPGLDISLEQIPGGTAVRSTTGSDGRATFKGLAPGTYRVNLAATPGRTVVAPGPAQVAIGGAVSVRAPQEQQGQLAGRTAGTSIVLAGAPAASAPTATNSSLVVRRSAPTVVGAVQMELVMAGGVSAVFDVAVAGDVTLDVLRPEPEPAADTENHNSSRSNSKQK
jgi:hypothetical protein